MASKREELDGRWGDAVTLVQPSTTSFECRISSNSAVCPCFPFKFTNLFVYSLDPADHTRRPPSAVMEQLGTLNATLRFWPAFVVPKSSTEFCQEILHRYFVNKTFQRIAIR